MRHLGCELTDSDKLFIREETSKLQSNVSSNGFNISDSLNGFGMNNSLFKSLKLFIYKYCIDYQFELIKFITLYITLIVKDISQIKLIINN